MMATRSRVALCNPSRLLLFMLAISGLGSAFAAPSVQTIQRGEYRIQVAPAPDWVDSAEIASDWDSKAPGAKEMQWRNWLVDDQTRRVNGERVRYVDRAYEAISAGMVSEAGKFETAFSPEYQTLTIHQVALRRDGVWHDRFNPDRITLARRESEFESDMATGVVSVMILLDDVRAKDIIRVNYSISGDNPILAGLDAEQANFGWRSPVLDRQFRVLFDPQAEVAEFRDERLPAASISRTKTHQDWRYHVHGTAEIQDESDYPNWYRLTPFVSLSEKRRWRDIAQWAVELYPKPSPLPADLQQRIDQWRTLPTVDAQITAALTAVQDEVRYFGIEIGDNTHRPAEPADVWSVRRGDCKDKSRLLVAILAEMDIKANPALVNSSMGKGIGALPPAASMFDHVIVQVHDGKQSLWLDPTQTQQRGPASAQDVGDFGLALPVHPDATKLVTVARNPKFIDRIDTLERLDIDADGNHAELTVRTEYVGASANQLRYQHSVDGTDALQRRYEEFYRRRYGEVASLNAVDVQDDPEQNRISVTEHYRLTEPWASTTPSLRSIDFYADNIAAVVKLPSVQSRATPLATAHPFLSSHRIEVRLPEGWQWQDEAASNTYDDPSASVATRRRQQDNLVVYEHDYQSKQAVVELEQMADHLRWRREVTDSISPRVILQIPSADAKKVRSNRLRNLIRDVIEENHNQQTPGSRNDQ